MKNTKFKKVIVVFIVSLFSCSVFATNGVEVEAKLHESFAALKNGVQDLSVKQNEMTEDELRQEATEVFNKVFNIRRMAGLVMGGHAQETTREQRDEFVEKFKERFFESYLDMFLEADNFSINITEVKVDGDTGQVNTVISESSGEEFEASFSVLKTEDKWLAQNIIIEGVNVGLNLRESFNDAVLKNNGDVMKAVENWNLQEEEMQIE